MIKVSPDCSKNVLILEAQGKLTDRDYKEVLIPRLESIIREHGKAPAAYRYGGSVRRLGTESGLGRRAIRTRAPEGFRKNGGYLRRKWVEWALRVGALLVEGEIRSFTPSERDDAHAWIQA